MNTDWHQLTDDFGTIRSASVATAGQASCGTSRRSCYFRSSLWRVVFLFSVLYTGLVLPAFGAESHLGDRLRPLIAAHQGKVAVAVKHLEKGEEFAHHADSVMPTASLIKVAVMATAYRLVDAGKLDLSRTVRTAPSAAVGLGCLVRGHAAALGGLPGQGHVRAGLAEKVEPQAKLTMGAAGPLVDILQRTLNARLSPSPELSVDGDFGSMTRAAVVRFQKEHGLPATGEVGPETWRALGKLVTQDEPVPEPAVVNAQSLPRDPPDDPGSAPLVTCQAWIIGDARTGKRLWGRNERRQLDLASTTKIMTAHLVFQLAEKNPGILDEEIVFSQQADDPIGSSAGLRAGERLPVRELLDGLLLPSGNDAAVALAERFGGRFNPPETAADTPDPVVRFVAEMNRRAKALGMNDTRFCNPHKLPAEGHLSTAADLLTLAHAALQAPLFREYVRTRQRGCSVTSTAGYTRNVLWKNTNRLLGIEGYEGVKTGTTDAAGACLVAYGSRAGQELLVVVLGAVTSDARYSDSRNLFQWAWRQRAK